MKKLIFILFILVASNANATTYWSSVSGGAASCGVASGTSDPGTYRTLTQGLACLAAGDTLILKSGTYTTAITSGSIPSGTSTSARTIVRSETSRGATLRPTASQAVIDFGACRNYIEISGLVLDGVNSGGTTSRTGVALSGVAGCYTGFLITDNEIKNTQGDGITTSGATFVTVTNNYIHDTGTNCRSNGSATPGLCHGIYAAQFTTDMTISENRLENCAGYCIHIYNEPAPLDRFFVTKNSMKNCGTEAGQSCLVNYSNNSAIGYNIVWGTIGEAAFLQRSGSAVLYYNNTVYVASGSRPGIQIEGGSSITCKNNLMMGSSTFSGACTTTTTNLTSQTAANHVVDAASGNFNLISTSAAIDVGTTAIGTITVGGLTINVTAASNGVGVDIGAFETWRLTNCNVGAVAANKLRCNVENNAASPVQAPSTTGWTALESGGNKAIASVAVIGTSIIEFTTSANYGSGTTCDVQYATTGSASDSSLIGGSLNQRLNAVSSVTCTNTVSGGGTSPVFTQTHARVRNLYGAEVAVAVDWKAPEDTAYTIIPGGAARLRIKSKVTTANPAAYNPTMQYDFNDNNWVAWTDTCSASVLVCAVGTALQLGVSNGAATTEQLTSDLATNIGCAVVLTSGAVPSLDPSQDSEWECEYGIRTHSSIAVGTVIRFRQIKDGATPYDTYSVYPTLTVANPGFTQF